jgi:hypothetical protein
MSLRQIAAQINEDLASQSSMRVGIIMRHPDGRMVKIKDGYYLDPVYGRVSNFWYWNEVKPNGRLGKEECGYGW